MQLRMPRGQVVSPRRRGYAGNRAARQAFFSSFFARFQRQNLTWESRSRCVSASRVRAAPRGTNRREDNPAQIEAEERISRRAGWERGDVCVERIDFRSSRGRRFWYGPTANGKSAVHRR